MTSDDELTRREIAFGRAMAQLRGEYAITHWPERAWAEVITSYWAKLGGFPNEVLAAVFSTAAKSYPDRFPTAGRLVALAEDRLKTFQGKQAALSSPSPSRRLKAAGNDEVELLARRMESGELRGADAARATRELVSKLGGPLADVVAGSLGAPNANGFCSGCGYPKKNHGTLGPCGAKFDEGETR